METLNCLIKCLHESVLAGKLQFELVLIHQRSLIQLKASTNMFCSIYSIKKSMVKINLRKKTIVKITTYPSYCPTRQKISATDHEIARVIIELHS